jgi:cytoskeletal protein RodZ
MGNPMDHKEQRYQHHEKEREEKKREERAFEEREAKSPWPFKPHWLVVLGIVVILAAVAIWQFIVW